MKPTYLIPFLTFISASVIPASAATEPESSIMASGTWSRIRVEQDGVYQLTYDRLRELGFSDPSKVKVFGYQPNILMTHMPDRMPADLVVLQSLNLPKEKKLFFYGKSDTNFAPEFWNGASNNVHDKHPYATGATYFLSDVNADGSAVSVGAAPSVEGIDPDEIWATHTALYFNEEDVENLSVGGVVFSGKRLNEQRPTETRTFTVNKVADAQGQMIYRCLLSPSSSSQKNYLQTTYSDGITAEESTGQAASWCTDSHERFHYSVRYQNIQLPVDQAERTYSVEFSMHPQASKMLHGSALDYFGLLYQRHNDLTGEKQMSMMFENWSEDIVFSVSGLTSDWHVWNVTDPSAISEMQFAKSNGNSLGQLTGAALYNPSVLVAFDAGADQPEPTLLGRVANQNLHALQTPELVIVAATPLMESARYAADFHRRHQGINVAVVDQQEVFNEYGSGNTSPEAIRRFLRHLDRKNPGVLRAMLIIGAASQNNSTAVADGAPFVVVPECEDEDYCVNITRSFFSDAFYGRLGEPASADLWAQRVAQFRVLGGDMTIGVGRLPFLSNADVMQYYAKAEQYIANPPAYAARGAALVASDYSTLEQESHLTNAEAFVAALGSEADNEITIYRAASNLFSSKDNVVTRRIIKGALERGVGFFSYFGHGTAQNIGGSTSTVDLLMQTTSVSQFASPGRYPIIYLGTCSAAPLDLYTTNISAELLRFTDGGGICVIASGREVYQPMNQNLGENVAHQYVNAKPGDWIGDVWRKAHTNAIQAKSLSKRNVANHLSYNFIGDPAMPLFACTDKVEVLTVNGSADGDITAKGDNEIKGRITDDNGNLNANFNGMITMTVYDVPTVRKNIAGTSSDPNYFNEVSVDMDEIGEYVAEVKNGQFAVSFNGPTSAIAGTHRIRFYAYSNDGSRRALGVRTDVTIRDDKAAETTPEAVGAPCIVDFRAGNGEVDVLNEKRVELTASIELPAGLAASSQLTKPVKLTIDGVSKPGMANMLTPSGVNTYSMRYVISDLRGGRHTATLSVLDAAGQWAESSIVFMVDNAPSANISAAVEPGSGDVSFELVSPVSGIASKRLIVERLDGSIVREVKDAAFPCKLSLDPGVYRVYVQLQSSSAVTSTPRIEVIID